MNYLLSTIVLAAGQSQRYGGNKLVSVRPESSIPLVVTALKQVLPVTNNTALLVTGKWHNDIVQIVDTYDLRNIKYLYNSQWGEGLSTSIRKGVEHVMRNTSDTSHVLISLADLPQVNADSLGKLVTQSKSNPDAIICSEFNGLLGVPAIFPIRYAQALCDLSGDTGAKALIASEASHNGRVVSVVHNEARIDIDRPEDWERFSPSL